MLSKFILKRVSENPAASDSVVGEYVFDGSLFTIGSDSAGTIVLPGAAAEQAVVIQEAEHLTLFNRSEGTALNGQHLRRESMQPLASGDEIRIGVHVIEYVAEVAPAENQVSRANAAAVAAPDIYATTKDIPIAHLIPNPAAKMPIATAEQRENTPEPPKKNARNFADVLNTLRTEEDSFYFIVENGSQENRRIPLEQTEMPLGLNSKGEITGAVAEINVLYAILRKDWSGIVIETRRGAAVFVNDEAVATTRRLRNGDIISFNTVRQNDKTLPFLKLHEPSSLVALESLLETRERGAGIQKNLNGAVSFNEAEPIAAEPNVPFMERRFFGHFNFFEVVSMIIGTLIGAVLIFLVLEFFVG